MTTDLKATDAELLQEFLLQRDEGAFREIVTRHASLVMGVCRQVLRHHQDAEDAFQATFVLLALRARTIQNRSCVASWLYRVAYRTALRAAKRRSTAGPLDGHEPTVDAASLEHIYQSSLRQAVYEELEQLPESYRDPLILCYLQEKTRAEAASELESTEPSVKARLARAKRMLRLRLARRGVAMSLALASVLDGQLEAASSVSTTLTEQTLLHASMPKRPHDWNVDFTSDIVTLVKQGNKAMMLASFTKPIVATLATGFVVLGISIAGADDEQALDGAPVVRRSSLQQGSGYADVALEAGLEIAVAQRDATVRSPFLAQSDPPPSRRPTPRQLQRPEPAPRPVTVSIPPSPTIPPWTAGYNGVQSQDFSVDRLKVEQSYLTDQADAYAKLAEALLIKSNEAETESDRLMARGEALLKRAEAKRAANLAAVYRREIERQAQTLYGVSSGIRPATPATPFSSQVPPTASPYVPRNGSDYGNGRVNRAPVHPLRIGVGDELKISVINADAIGVVVVEPEGTVPLGPLYGRIKFAGLTISEAEKVTLATLKKSFSSPSVQIVMVKKAPKQDSGWRAGYPSTSAAPASRARPTTDARGSRPAQRRTPSALTERSRPTATNQPVSSTTPRRTRAVSLGTRPLQPAAPARPTVLTPVPTQQQPPAAPAQPAVDAIPALPPNQTQPPQAQQPLPPPGVQPPQFQPQVPQPAVAEPRFDEAQRAEPQVDQAQVAEPQVDVVQAAEVQVAAQPFDEAQVDIAVAAEAAPQLFAAPVADLFEQPVVSAPCCTAGNAALGNVATASSTQHGRAPRLAVDGDLGTRWCAVGDNENSWSLELEDPLHVKGLRIHWELLGTIYRYKVDASKDGADWKTIVDASDNEEESGVSEHQVDFPSAKHIRITFLGNSKGAWGSIREFEVSPEKELAPLDKQAWEKVKAEASVLFNSPVSENPDVSR